MRHLDIKLRQLSLALHGLGGTSLLVGAVLLNSLLLRPLDRQEAEVRERMKTVEAQLGKAGEIRLRHQELTTALRELEKRSEDIRRRIPDLPNESEFLAELTQIAQREQVKILDYRLGAITQAPSHSQMSVQLALEGNYQGICGFLDQLEKLPRVMTVERLDVQTGPQQTVLPVNMTLVLYFGLNPTPASNHAA